MDQTPRLGLNKPPQGNTNWATEVNGNWDTLDACGVVTHNLIKIVSGGGTGTYSQYVVQPVDPETGADYPSSNSTISGVWIKDDSSAYSAGIFVGALFTSPSGVKMAIGPVRQ